MEMIGLTIPHHHAQPSKHLTIIWKKEYFAFEILCTLYAMPRIGETSSNEARANTWENDCKVQYDC